jgi:hypothetical protein
MYNVHFYINVHEQNMNVIMNMNMNMGTKLNMNMKPQTFRYNNFRFGLNQNFYIRLWSKLHCFIST